MSAGNSTERTAQLDKAERDQLEDVVIDLREKVEEEIEYELEHHYELTEREGGENLSEEEQDTRERLVEAIDYEGDEDHSWQWRYQQYISGVGYTIVNRLAAFRCMEVRGFLDRPVTQLGESGLTPAAERILGERFDLDRDEAIIAAYHDECEQMADELEILFDPDSRYSVIDPDADLYRELIHLLDELTNDIWRADDVLGWIYEYYNRPIVEALEAKNSLEPEDVGPANQFYTPHWVVRMLTDNSLGKLYLESTDQESSIPEPDALSPEERKERLVTPEDSATIPELCTYLIPDEDPGDAPEFDHPRELSVIDPACGSGHFLLYAFDVLERIWWAETDLDRAEVPAKVLEHNLYGVDIDLRSCQLSAFNLYLKARMRAEEEGGQFKMPNVDIICADARVAEIEDGAEVLDEITGEGTDLREALGEIIDTFQHTEALGSLLDVSGTLEDVFESGQTGLSDWDDETHQSLNSFLKALREAVDERLSDSFGEQNLRSFLNLLVVLTREYDVALMNPPYGSQGRIPPNVRQYLEEEYRYTAEYYINFFERCLSMTQESGRIGMIVPRTFMFKQSLEDFREDFIGRLGTFDFLTEYGNDVLDNATVRTTGTVVRAGNTTSKQPSARFIRLHDVPKEKKERRFLETSFNRYNGDIERNFVRDLEDFSLIPGSPLSYWMPKEIRSLFDSDIVFDADNGGLDVESAGSVKAGLTTGDNDRFVRRFWESSGSGFVPYAKGGKDAWLLPRIDRTLYWGQNGSEVKRHPGSYPRNEDYYFEEVLTYTYLKEGGRRFGYLNPGSLFDHAGKIFAPDVDSWSMLGYANSHLITYLMLGQTPDRHWEVSHVSRLPWPRELEGIKRISQLPKDAVGHIIQKRQHEFNSPYYIGPILLHALGVDDQLSQYEHPHRKLREELNIEDSNSKVSKSASMEKLGEEAARHLETVSENFQSCTDDIDEAVFNSFDITKEQREIVLQEIALRTNEDPQKREQYNPEAVTGPSDDFPEQVKDLLLHFTLRAVNDADDGIIPLSDVDGINDLLAHIEAEFERVWGGHATDRLAEVDEVLGNRSAADEAYPNLRAWLKDDLFEYHVTKFDRTPILWHLTSERLTSNGDLEGFSCLVDYHQLDAGILDSLSANYLDRRREELRDRRNAADRRRNNQSLGVEKQSEAADEFHRYQNSLEQLNAFEQGLEALARTADLDRPEDMQETAQDGADIVTEFREKTVTRLDLLDELAAMDDVDMQELFSNSFYETVQEERREWIDALEDLETAFESYGDPDGGPVEAHLYDLFTYFDDVVGSDHFASNGILFMTWYFDDFEPIDQQRLGELSDRERILGELAQDLDEYKQLAEDISDACSTVQSEIDDDWEYRALEEITAAGYRPNHKHGVAINITPFAEQNLVPEIVEDKVL